MEEGFLGGVDTLLSERTSGLCSLRLLPSVHSFSERDGKLSDADILGGLGVLDLVKRDGEFEVGQLLEDGCWFSNT